MYNAKSTMHNAQWIKTLYSLRFSRTPKKVDARLCSREMEVFTLKRAQGERSSWSALGGQSHLPGLTTSPTLAESQESWFRTPTHRMLQSWLLSITSIKLVLLARYGNKASWSATCLVQPPVKPRLRIRTLLESPYLESGAANKSNNLQSKSQNPLAKTGSCI